MAEVQGFSGKIDPERFAALVETFMTKFIGENGGEDSPIAQGMLEGLTAAQAMGLGRDDLNALYTVFFRSLNDRDFAAAYDGFTYLVMIDPLHAPNHYCLGVALQGLGRMAEAEGPFISFLAVDATNPHGYLRLGECYQSRGATPLAIEAFELAEAECRNGHGDSLTLEEARAKLMLVKREIDP